MLLDRTASVMLFGYVARADREAHEHTGRQAGRTAQSPGTDNT